jgi:hypothetical protein
MDDRSGAPPAPRVEPLDALASAADALYTSSDDTSALRALRCAEAALDRVAEARAGDPEVARAFSEVASARALLSGGFAADVRGTASRLYELSIVMLESGATIYLRLLRLLLRRTIAAAAAVGEHGPERLILFARAASRAVALETSDDASFSQTALDRVLADAHSAAHAHDRDAVRNAAQRAIRILERRERESRGSPSFRERGEGGRGAHRPGLASRDGDEAATTG